MRFIDNNNYDNALFEMANLYPDETGLNSTIWVDDGKKYVRGGHFKRLKAIVKNDSRAGYVSYSLIDGERLEKNGIKYRKKDIPKDEKEIKKFIMNNQENLLKLSDGKITSDDFKMSMKRINESIDNNYIISDEYILQDNFLKDCYNHIWEENDDLLEDEEMNFLFYEYIIIEENAKELENIYDNAFSKYLDGINVDAIINETINECVPFVDRVTKFYQEYHFPLDDIDIYALAEYTTRYILGYEIAEYIRLDKK